MWIRSQDRTRLLDCKYLAYNFFKEEKTIEIVEWIDRNTSIRLAVYKTKERALEVLDEMQKNINGYWLQEFSNLDNPNDIWYEKRGIEKSNVYEMPKE